MAVIYMWKSYIKENFMVKLTDEEGNTHVVPYAPYFREILQCENSIEILEKFIKSANTVQQELEKKHDVYTQGRTLLFCSSFVNLMECLANRINQFNNPISEGITFINIGISCFGLSMMFWAITSEYGIEKKQAQATLYLLKRELHEFERKKRQLLSDQEELLKENRILDSNNEKEGEIFDLQSKLEFERIQNMVSYVNTFIEERLDPFCSDSTTHLRVSEMERLSRVLSPKDREKCNDVL